MRGGQGHVDEERLERFRFPLNKSRRPVSQCGEDRLKRPSLEGRPLLAGLISNKELRSCVFTWNSNGAIIFNEAVGWPVWNVRSEILVKADRNRPPGNGFGENLAPCCPLFVCGGEVLFAPVARTRKQLLLSGGDRPIPAQVPLADACGVVPVFFGQPANGQAIRGDERRPPKTNDTSLQSRPPMVTPC